MSVSGWWLGQGSALDYLNHLHLKPTEKIVMASAGQASVIRLLLYLLGLHLPIAIGVRLQTTTVSGEDSEWNFGHIDFIEVYET